MLDGVNFITAAGDPAIIRVRPDSRYNIETESSVTWGVDEAHVRSAILAGERALAKELADAANEVYLQSRNRALAEGVPFIVPTTACDYREHIQTSCIALTVELADSAFDRFEEWYRNITLEALTGMEQWLRVFSNVRTGWEPRVRVRYQPGVALPHPVVDAGTVGKGNVSDTPRFLLFYERGVLENNYQAYFEGILRAGWRP